MGGANTCQDLGTAWGTGPAAAVVGACTGAVNCQMNYVIIPGAQSDATCKADATLCYIPPDGMERYCGTVLTAEGSVTLLPGIVVIMNLCLQLFSFNNLLIPFRPYNFWILDWIGFILICPRHKICTSVKAH